MKLSSIALGTVAAVATVTVADAGCSVTTFNAMVAKASERGYNLPSRGCMEQVFERSCRECGNSFSCYAKKGQQLSRGIPECSRRQRLRRRMKTNYGAYYGQYDEDDLGWLETNQWSKSKRFDEDEDSLGRFSSGDGGKPHDFHPTWRI